MTETLRRYASALWIVAAVVVGVTAFVIDARRIQKLTLAPTRSVTVKKIHECSGLAYWPSRRHLLTVADSGYIAELSLEGEVVRERREKGMDFEDIVLVDDEHAMIVDEQQHLLADLRLSDLAVTNQRALPVISPAKGTNRMFEGITTDPVTKRTLLVHESHPAAVVRLAQDGITPEHAAILESDSLSGIDISPDGRYAILVSNQGYIILMDLAQRTILGEVRTPMRRIEGCALVPGVGLFACTDANESKLLVFESLNSWDAIRTQLTGRKSR